MECANFLVMPVRGFFFSEEALNWRAMKILSGIIGLLISTVFARTEIVLQVPPSLSLHDDNVYLEAKVILPVIAPQLAVLKPEESTPVETPTPQIAPIAPQSGAFTLLPQELLRAISCESSFEGTATGKPQQFEKDGTVRKHVNISGSIDYGAGMINDRSWDRAAKEMNLNYKESLEDNLKLTEHIYNLQGIKAFYAYDPVKKDCVWKA